MTQVEYLAILFDDCGFSGSARRAWLLVEYGVKFAEQLTVADRSVLIDRLKVMKANLKVPQKETEDEEL